VNVVSGQWSMVRKTVIRSTASAGFLSRRDKSKIAQEKRSALMGCRQKIEPRIPEGPPNRWLLFTDH
jgi:hypothetical protein